MIIGFPDKAIARPWAVCCGFLITPSAMSRHDCFHSIATMYHGGACVYNLGVENFRLSFSINLFITALPYVGTNKSNCKYLVPRTGLGS